jgi:hypothetical protein
MITANQLKAARALLDIDQQIETVGPFGSTNRLWKPPTVVRANVGRS